FAKYYWSENKVGRIAIPPIPNHKRIICRRGQNHVHLLSSTHDCKRHLAIFVNVLNDIGKVHAKIRLNLHHSLIINRRLADPGVSAPPLKWKKHFKKKGDKKRPLAHFHQVEKRGKALVFRA